MKNSYEQASGGDFKLLNGVYPVFKPLFAFEITNKKREGLPNQLYNNVSLVIIMLLEPKPLQKLQIRQRYLLSKE